MAYFKSNGSSAGIDIMQNLKSGYHKCEIVDRKLVPCGYHNDRKNAEIYGVCDDGGCASVKMVDSRHSSTLSRSAHINHLLKELSYDGNIAGGWWLIKEQREWLKAHLQSALKQIQGDCHILVAGVAGYAHFYSYLRIVFDAANSVDFDISRLYIDVIDSCIFPLLAITEIEKSVRATPKWCFLSSLQKTYNVMGEAVTLSKHNRDFIKKMAPDICKCHIRTLHGSIMQMAKKFDNIHKKYDIITEHFLLSMIENVDKLIDESRANYQQVMKSGAHLLMACGFDSMNFVNRLVEIHHKYKMVTIYDEIVKVWDPFGLTRSELQDILNDLYAEPRIRLDNCLIDFICTE